MKKCAALTHYSKETIPTRGTFFPGLLCLVLLSILLSSCNTSSPVVYNPGDPEADVH